MYPHLTDQQNQQEILSTITSKGQVTLPKAVRDHLGVSTHDRVSFVIAEDGTITLQVPRFPTIASLAGIAGTLDQPRSWAEMRQIARDDALAARHQPSHVTPGNRAGQPPSRK
jgi:AbrB family looped-hinge helix DNA binding protein